MAITHIFQINISSGGVPKSPIRQAEVTRLGVTGDRQNDQVSHGGPERAVCIYSLELVLALQAEGHPVYPGALGENLTLAGMDWSTMLPGAQILVGDAVLLEITSFTNPCKKLAESFLDRDFQRISQKSNPGWSRVYARVLQEGALRVGDLVKGVS